MKNKTLVTWILGVGSTVLVGYMLWNGSSCQDGRMRIEANERAEVREFQLEKDRLISQYEKTDPDFANELRFCESMEELKAAIQRYNERKTSG